MLYSIISYLENHFQSIQVTDPTLQALLVFDTSLWPSDRAEVMEGVLMTQWNLDFSNPHFFKPPNNLSQKLFLSSQSNTVISPLIY